MRLQLIAHEPAEDVVAHHGRERHAQPELGRAAREDGARPADDHLRVVDEPFRLPERRHHLVPDQHEVRIGVTEHQDIEARHATQRTGRAGPLS